MNLPLSSAGVRPPSRRGSIMVTTLLLVGVLAISIAAMLSSVRHLARSADNKIAEEECYQAALAGLNTARAWMMNPNLARLHNPNTNIGNALEAVTSGALKVSQEIILNPSLATSMTDEALAGYFNGEMSKNGVSITREADGGRKVLFEWGGGTNKPLVIRRGDANFGTPSTTLFNATLGNDARSWVEKIKVTTPYRTNGTSAAGSFSKDDLRLVSMIVEVEAHTAGAGVEKVRVISGKVLAIPQIVMAPPAQSGAAIVTGAGITVQGNSSMNVHWGPVWSVGNVTILGLEYNKSSRSISFQSNKYTGIGANDPFGANEKWVRWMAGSNKFLVDDKGDRIFTTGGNNNVEIKDFFAQLLNPNSVPGSFTGTASDWDAVDDPATPNTNEFLRRVSLSGFPWDLASAEGILYDKLGQNQTVYAEGSGAFVQNTSQVDQLVSASQHSLDYKTWKNFAIANNGYLRPRPGGGYNNASGQQLYVTTQRTLTTVSSGNTPLTELKQLSMKNLVPADGNTAGILDRMLFVDSQEGTENGATKPSISLNSQDDFFWKGMLFINGNLGTTGGGGFPTIWAKNPDQYNATPPDRNSKGQGQLVSNVYVDGILRVMGNMSRQGNAAIYGSLVVGMPGQGSFNGGGSPDVYYNTRCRDGIFKSPMDPRNKALVSGPVVELNSFL